MASADDSDVLTAGSAYTGSVSGTTGYEYQAFLYAGVTYSLTLDSASSAMNYDLWGLTPSESMGGTLNVGQTATYTPDTTGLYQVNLDTASGAPGSYTISVGESGTPLNSSERGRIVVTNTYSDTLTSQQVDGYTADLSDEQLYDFQFKTSTPLNLSIVGPGGAGMSQVVTNGADVTYATNGDGVFDISVDTTNGAPGTYSFTFSEEPIAGGPRIFDWEVAAQEDNQPGDAPVSSPVSSTTQNSNEPSDAPVNLPVSSTTPNYDQPDNAPATPPVITGVNESTGATISITTPIAALPNDNDDLNIASSATSGSSITVGNGNNTIDVTGDANAVITGGVLSHVDLGSGNGDVVFLNDQDVPGGVSWDAVTNFASGDAIVIIGAGPGNTAETTFPGTGAWSGLTFEDFAAASNGQELASFVSLPGVNQNQVAIAYGHDPDLGGISFALIVHA